MLKGHRSKDPKSDDSIHEELAKAFFGEGLAEEKKKKPSSAPWVIAIVVITVIAITAAFYTQLDVKIEVKRKPLNEESIVKGFSFNGDAKAFSKKEQEITCPIMNCQSHLFIRRQGLGKYGKSPIKSVP